MAWTAEQQAAIDDRGHHLLLSAAAGSGKTAVLVERIIQRLTDPVDPVEITELLVMTFTRAAALEMRTRIGLALAKVQGASPTPHLERQLALLGTASISTIHSFCTQVIRQYFYRLDLDAGYRQGAETELALWRIRALDETLLAYYESGNETFYHLVDAFRQRNEDTLLRQTMQRLYDYSRSLPFPEAWLDTLARRYDTTDEQVKAQLADCRETWKKLWQRWHDDLVVELETLRPYPKLQKAVAVLQNDIDCLQILSQATDWETIYDTIHGHSFKTWPGGRFEGVEKELKDHARNVRNTIKESLENQRTTFLASPPSEWAKDMTAMYEPVRLLIEITKAFGERFARYKKQERLIDFSDLEHLCLSLLLAPESTPEKPIPSAIAQELASRYREVMVDEYQDTNGVQELIASLVSRDNNRFMVGDVKQSIYRFRLADPSIFMAKYESYAQGDGSTKRIDLSRNFRSDATILEAVNEIFREIMRKPHAELEYGPAEALYPGRVVANPPDSWVGGSVSLHMITTDTIPEEMRETSIFAPEELANFDRISATATAVAAEIRRLMAAGCTVQDKDGRFRPLSWRDITILMRSVSGVADRYMDIFHREGIPVYAEQAGGYFAAPEIRMMLALLAVVDNPRRDLDLATVLRSVMVGWDENELAALRIHVGKDTLWTGLQTVSLAAETKKRTCRFLAQWETWRRTAQTESVAKLLRHIYEDTDYPAYVSGMQDGAIRETNLEALYRRARDFDETVGTGLSGFLRYIRRLKREAQDLAIPSAVGENEDVVRIMTIHKSKGLEFPVVFLVHTEKSFNLRELTDPVLLHREFGLGIERYVPEMELSYPTVAHYLLRERLYRESLAEEQRLLYVAMTRARDKLYIYGATDDDEEKKETRLLKWEEVGKGNISANSYLDWIMSVLNKNLPILQDTESLDARWRIRWEKVHPAPLSDEKDNGRTRFIKEMQMMYRQYMEGIGRTEQPDMDAAAEREITGQIAWDYPGKTATQVPAKLTVTEVVHRHDDLAHHTGIPTHAYALPERTETDSVSAACFRAGRRTEERPQPVYLTAVSAEEEPAPISDESPAAAVQDDFTEAPAYLTKGMEPMTGGTVYGTLIHRILEQIAVQIPENMESALDNLVQRGFITPAERRNVSLADFKRWAESDIAARLRAAPHRYLELNFGKYVPAMAVFDDDSLQDERIFLQGVIDCLFIEEDGIVIVDYKTDRIQDVAELYERYSAQLELYAYAAAQILGKPVKEKILYSVRLGTFYSW